jgi:hypothetical protein
MPRDVEHRTAPPRARGRVPPLIWLGAAIFVASLAGCVWMIVLAARHADTELGARGSAILAVPLTRAVPPAPAGAR